MIKEKTMCAVGICGVSSQKKTIPPLSLPHWIRNAIEREGERERQRERYRDRERQRERERQR